MRARVFSGLVLFLLGASACRIQGLQFREDQRLKILAPAHRAVVTLPVVVRWEAKDFEVSAGSDIPLSSSHFGVFLDLTPQPPGKGLEYFFRKDPTCRTVALCLTPEYLSQNGIFQLNETTFTIETVGQRLGAPKDQQDWHEVTVVLLDGKGRRIGESGTWVLFKLKR